MKNNIFRQTAFEMRQQPLITSVSLIGTAFAIFLMMVVMMIQSVRTLPMAPESKRPQLMYGMWFDAIIEGNTTSSGMSLPLAQRIYSGLDGVESITYMGNHIESIDVDAPGRTPVNLYMRESDAGFWKVFDHTFVAGSPFDQSHVDAPTENRVAVLSEDAVRQVLGCTPDEAIGRTVNISQKPTTVIGVVKNSSPLAPYGFAQVFRPIIPERHAWDARGYYGSVMAAMVIKPGTTREHLQQQVKARYAEIDTELKPGGGETRYHEQPFDHELSLVPMGSNTTPDNSKEKRERAILMLILLLVPAINMSSLTQSRLKRRYAEVGVKRAYGAPRNRILAEILTENFLITLIGGAIGLILSILAACLLTDTVFAGLTGEDDNYTAISVSASLPLNAVFNWAMFGFALACCFLLNLLSAGIPAWRASRVSPVEALHS